MGVRLIKRVSRRAQSFLRRLFVPEKAPDHWQVVDDQLLHVLIDYLPQRPAGFKVCSLDFTACPHVQALPPGILCDQLRLAGTAIRSLPRQLHVKDLLDLRGCKRLTTLPTGLKVRRLDLEDCTALTWLPASLHVEELNLIGCTGLTALPDGLRCSTLDLTCLPLETLPDNLHVRNHLSLFQCRRLSRLPNGLWVHCLNLGGCTALRSLPQVMDVNDLYLEGCTQLEEWPPGARVSGGRLVAAGCRRLPALSCLLQQLESLDLRDCISLSELPPNLRVRGWIDVANTGLQGLPVKQRGTQLRWRGVLIDETIAFHPEKLQARDIASERNIERRRVMLERFGMDRFMGEMNATVLDSDTDAGGSRKLLQVRLANDEPLVCVAVSCPSTQRRYLLRVPPRIETCHQAVAWTAGFDDPDLYAPIVES